MSKVNPPHIKLIFLDNWSKTPLHYAAQRGSNISGLYLLTKGAEVNAVDDDGNTPMALAMLCEHPSKLFKNGLLRVINRFRYYSRIE
jgi:ankyrin repeat protein